MIKTNQIINIYDQSTRILKVRFRVVNDIIINSSRNTFTDTCTIVLPQRTRRVNKKITDVINIGDIIEVFYGYGTNLINEFNGYITGINPDSPMTLMCEDESFIYKNQSIGVNHILINASFESLLSAIYPNAYRTTNDTIGDWTISKNSTVVEVLEEIRRKLKVPCYWQDEILYVNYEFEKDPNKKVVFDVQGNVPLGSDQIDIQAETNLSIVAYGISEQKDGTKIERYAYYEDLTGENIKVTDTRPTGVLNKLSIPKITATQLESYITRWLPSLYYKGAIGRISGKCPSFKHGDLAVVLDSRINEHEGVYDIPEVEKTFSLSTGITQTATLGLKVG